MQLNPPTLGALVGVAIVLLLAVIARRSEKRALEQRLQIVQDRIRRRQEQLALQQRAGPGAAEATDGGSEARSD
jgi:Trp operon repressor